jgi:hypothetical protein
MLRAGDVPLTHHHVLHLHLRIRHPVLALSGHPTSRQAVRPQSRRGGGREPSTKKPLMMPLRLANLVRRQWRGGRLVWSRWCEIVHRLNLKARRHPSWASDGLVGQSGGRALPPVLRLSANGHQRWLGTAAAKAGTRHIAFEQCRPRRRQRGQVIGHGGETGHGRVKRDQ